MLRSLNVRYALIQFSYWGGFGSLWGFIALLLRHYGFTDAQTGVITACATLLSVVLSPALSAFLDAQTRLDNRHGAAVPLGLAAALCALLFFSAPSSLLPLGVCFVLIGTLLASAPPFENAMAMDAVRSGFPVSYGFCRGVGSVAYAVAVLLLGYALERQSPTVLLPVCALLIAFGLVFLLTFRLPSTPAAAEAEQTGRATFALLRGEPRFALTLLGSMFFFLTHTLSNTYAPALVGKVGGTSAAIGAGLALSAVLELPGMTLVSRLRNRFRSGFFLRVAAGTEVLKFLVFYFAPTLPILFIGHALQFFQFAFYTPATVYYVADHLPAADQRKGQSLIYVAGSGLGASLGNLLGGQIVERSGIQAALLLGIASAVASFITFSLSTASARGAKK